MLFVSHEGRIGGAERSLLLLIKHLVQQGGIRVALACPPDGPLAAEAVALGCRIYPLYSRPRVGGISLIGAAWWIGLSMQVRRAWVAFRPDIVHANSVYSMPLCWFLWPRGRTKVVWHVRDLPRRRTITRLCGRLSDRVIAVSGAVKERLLREGLGGDSIDVVHNGIEPPTAGMIDQRPSSIPFSARNDGRIVFANVGQFVPWKKQMLFLAAAALVARELPQAEFWLVGDDLFGQNVAYKQELRRLGSGGELAGRVRFVGWQDDMAGIWPLVDCMVHTADTEPFGRVIIESMAAWVPVIAADGGGPGEIIERNVTGILVPPDEAASLAQAMLQVAREPSAAARLASAARQRVMEKFTAAQTAAKVEQVYRSLLSDSLPLRPVPDREVGGRQYHD